MTAQIILLSMYLVCGADGDFEYYYDLWDGTINIL